MMKHRNRRSFDSHRFASVAQDDMHFVNEPQRLGIGIRDQQTVDHWR